MDNFAKYLGVIIVLLGAALIVGMFYLNATSVFLEGFFDNNFFLVFGLFLSIGGCIAHIALNKKA